MGFSEKIILFENFNEPLGIGNNTPTLQTDVKIDIDSDQDFVFARVFVKVCYPASLFGSAFRMEFNGKTLGSQTWNPFEGGCKTLDVVVTDLMKDGKNNLKVHLDGFLQGMDAVVNADLFYELNTPKPPNDVEVGDPEKKDRTKELLITGGIIVTGVVLSAVVINSLFKRTPAGRVISLIKR